MRKYRITKNDGLPQTRMTKEGAISEARVQLMDQDARVVKIEAVDTPRPSVVQSTTGIHS